MRGVSDEKADRPVDSRSRECDGQELRKDKPIEHESRRRGVRTKLWKAVFLGGRWAAKAGGWKWHSACSRLSGVWARGTEGRSVQVVRSQRVAVTSRPVPRESRLASATWIRAYIAS